MKSSRNFHAYGSKNYLSVSGYFEANFEITRKELAKFYVIDRQHGILMSINLATKLSVLTILNQINYYTKKINLNKRYHQLELDEDSP